MVHVSVTIKIPNKNHSTSVILHNVPRAMVHQVAVSADSTSSAIPLRMDSSQFSMDPLHDLTFLNVFVIQQNNTHSINKSRVYKNK